MRQSIILLDNTGTKVNVTGHKTRAAGYYSSGMNLYTLAMYLDNFSGRIYLQASLAVDPKDDDWFYVNLNGYLEYLEYLPHAPDVDNNTGFTSVFPLSFQGNFVWLRAIVDRSTLQNPDTTNYGQVSKILVNY